MLPWRQIMIAGMLGPLGPLGPKCFVQQSLAVELNEAQPGCLTRDGVAIPFAEAGTAYRVDLVSVVP
jgi:hypothetical protein